MSLENHISHFTKESLTTIQSLFDSNNITRKEQIFFNVVFMNTENTLKQIIKDFCLNKVVVENDFDWLMALYTAECFWQLHDLMDYINKSNEEIIKNILDIDLEKATKYIEKIIGGQEIEKYSKSILDYISSEENESKSLDEYLSRHVSFIFLSFQKGGVIAPLIKELNINKISNDIYNKNLMNLIVICVG